MILYIYIYINQTYRSMIDHTVHTIKCMIINCIQKEMFIDYSQGKANKSGNNISIFSFKKTLNYSSRI